ncbi:hypothetical protein EAO71_36555 [Streptomyces sp. ms191]|uniref:hypothetical protein n=1 Tax=Streptomyces sp. ms191 TaxID=1827978 RepID=UPI0011CE6A93|nr:hypothetical protein [Streptomyces sp. ms191]TXS10872.1 hypothetical protein EAO71_36555 [Streptomyces sp. ms191]
MSARYATQTRRGAIAVVLAALVLGVAGCGSEDEPPKNTASSPSRTPAGTEDGKKTQTEEPSEVLAVLKGQNGLELTIQSAKRDAGGFLTVSGKLANTSDATSVIPAQVAGDEVEIVKHGDSLGGATLVDSVEKKRYYVLRDTDGRPLTTSGLADLGPGRSTAVFLQFPAPPASTTEVTFQLPTFRTGTIKLS